MFNFFREIKDKVAFKGDALNDYNVVNISGKVLYIEGHKGLLALQQDYVCVKLKRGAVDVRGGGMVLAELTENTIILQGRIDSVEARGV